MVNHCNPATPRVRVLAREIIVAHSIRIGTAGWSVPADPAGTGGSQLARYSRVFNAVEINSSFYRSHRASTYERWAAAVPPDFRFAVKMPRAITHERRLREADDLVARFADESLALGGKLGALLVQLPPNLLFEAATVAGFFETVRRRFAAPIACEPRHASWFAEEVADFLREHAVARVAADPPRAEGAEQPAGDPATVYYRLHGSPRIYRSAYEPDFLQRIAGRIVAQARDGADVWCIFDNTASGAAYRDATTLVGRIPSTSR